MSLSTIARMTHDEAFVAFKKYRWADNNGEPYCPACHADHVHFLRSRRIWKCGRCTKQFSVTSGTMFSGHKLPLRDYLFAVAMFANEAKGISALSLSRSLNVNYRTAFELLKKMRSQIAAAQAKVVLSGTIEIDGAYFGGHLRHMNTVWSGREKRISEKKYVNRRSVVVMRQRAGRTVTTVGKKESDALPVIERHLSPGSFVHADQAHAWDKIKDLFEMARINHKREFVSNDASTNYAESYFALLRRSSLGVHHRISGEYLHLYAAEVAWRIDHNRVANGERLDLLMNLAFSGGKTAPKITPRQEPKYKYDAFNKVIPLHMFTGKDGSIVDDRLRFWSQLPDQEQKVFAREVLEYVRRLKETHPNLSRDAVIGMARQFVAAELAA